MANKETERKWIVKYLPPEIAPQLESLESVLIEQGYIPMDGRPEQGWRVRRVTKPDGSVEFPPVVDKIATGEEHTKEESNPAGDGGIDTFDQLWPLTERERVTYTRYFLPSEDYVIHLDSFSFPPQVAGQFMPEVEFTSVEDALAYKPPLWFGPETNITKHAIAQGGELTPIESQKTTDSDLL